MERSPFTVSISCVMCLSTVGPNKLRVQSYEFIYFDFKIHKIWGPPSSEVP